MRVRVRVLRGDNDCSQQPDKESYISINYVCVS